MDTDSTRQGVLFNGLSKKALVAHFDQEQASSDGGAVLIKACDRRLGLSLAMSACLRDNGQAEKVDHAYQSIFQQRMFGIACGYADGNDAARLSGDPVFKLLAERDPVTGSALASQATLSRFENAVSSPELLQMSAALAEAVIRRHRRRKRRVKRIAIDLDPTHDTWCYLPLAGFLSFDKEPDQYLFCYVLRPGDAATKLGCLTVLRRLLPRLRKGFPGARLRIRLDAGFAGPELYEFFEAERLEYVVCMSKNSTLATFAEPLMAPLRDALAAGDDPVPAFGECRYRARSWQRIARSLGAVPT